MSVWRGPRVEEEKVGGAGLVPLKKGRKDQAGWLNVKSDCVHRYRKGKQAGPEYSFGSP